MLNTLISLLGVAVVGAFGWIFQLGNRVTKLEADHGSFTDLLNIQFADVRQRLTRIEASIDKGVMNND